MWELIMWELISWKLISCVQILSTVLSLQSFLKERCYWKLVCLLPLSLYQLATSYIKVLRQDNIFHLSSVVETLDLHCPGIVVSEEGEQDTVNNVKFILQPPLLNTKRETSHANSDKPTCRTCSVSISVQPPLGALQSDWSITLQCLSWLEFRNSRRQSHGSWHWTCQMYWVHGQLQRCFSLTHSSQIHIHTLVSSTINVYSQFVFFASPSHIHIHTLISSLTHSLSSRCLPLPMVHWSCSPTLQCTKTFQPSCTQQECL